MWRKTYNANTYTHILLLNKVKYENLWKNKLEFTDWIQYNLPERLQVFWHQFYQSRKACGFCRHAPPLNKVPILYCHHIAISITEQKQWNWNIIQNFNSILFGLSSRILQLLSYTNPYVLISLFENYTV